MAEKGSTSVVERVKKFLTFAVIGLIVYFVIKYWSWFKAGAGVFALAAALPFLADIIGGVLGVAGSIVMAVVGFIRARFKKAEDEKEAGKDPDQADAEATSDIESTVDAATDSESSIPPGYEGNVSMNITNNGQLEATEAFSTDDPDGAESAGGELGSSSAADGNGGVGFEPEEE